MSYAKNNAFEYPIEVKWTATACAIRQLKAQMPNTLNLKLPINRTEHEYKNALRIYFKVLSANAIDARACASLGAITVDSSTIT